MEKFRLEKFFKCDKDLEIHGPDQLEIRIDYDDVDPAVVEKATKKLIRILNEHWEDAEN